MFSPSTPVAARSATRRLIVGVFTVLAVLLCGPQAHGAPYHTHAASPHPSVPQDVVAPATMSMGAVLVEAAGHGQVSPKAPAGSVAGTADGAHLCVHVAAVADKYVPGGSAAASTLAVGSVVRSPAVVITHCGRQRLSGRSLLLEHCVSRT